MPQALLYPRNSFWIPLFLTSALYLVLRDLKLYYWNFFYFIFLGEYAGFDETQPTAESGGKGKVISLLKEKYGFKKIVMIGDGATDLEACPPAVSAHPICFTAYEW